MKKLLIMIAMLIVATTGVMACNTGFREVDCGSSWWWNTDICRDFELQDEFDEVADMINTVEHDSKQRDRWLRYKILLNQHQDGQDRKYVLDHETKWSEDKVGGGMSLSDLGDVLLGDKWFFTGFQPQTFIDYLEKPFVTESELAVVNDRIDLLFAVIGVIEENIDFETHLKATKIKAKRTKEPQSYDGFVCYPGREVCVAS